MKGTGPMELYSFPEAPLFDRFRPDADMTGLPPRQAASSYRRLLLADLELLLNTRAPWPAQATLPAEVAASVVAYGLPDLGGVSLRSMADRASVCERVRDAIAAFEPRLTGIVVEDLTEERPGGSRMSLRVRADLNIDNTRFPLLFETQLAPLTNQLHVRALDGSDLA